LTRVERVKQLSDRVLTSLADEVLPDLAIMALLDAAVRVLCVSNRALDTAAACKELARVAEEIGRAERTS
jgi:hypothetical protein